MTFLKKIVVKPLAERRTMIDKADEQIRVVEQCELLQLSRNGFYHELAKEGTENLTIVRFLDE